MQKIPFPEHIRGQSPNTSCSKQTHGRRTVRSGIDSFHRRTSGAGIAPEAFHFSGAQTGQADRKGRCPYRWKTDRANCTVAKDTPKTARPKKRQKGPARDANISRSRNRMEVWNLPGSGRQCPYFFEPQPSAAGTYDYGRQGIGRKVPQGKFPYPFRRRPPHLPDEFTEITVSETVLNILDGHVGDA